jgi:hypothetical protein
VLWLDRGYFSAFSRFRPMFSEDLIPPCYRCLHVKCCTHRGLKVLLNPPIKFVEWSPVVYVGREGLRVLAEACLGRRQRCGLGEDSLVCGEGPWATHRITRPQSLALAMGSNED